VRAVAGTFVGPRSESRRCGAWRKLAGLPNINDPMFDEPREHPGGLRAIFRMQDAIDYYDGEVPPAKK
jgi:hypothetical protein